jgi:hypothetical protein
VPTELHTALLGVAPREGRDARVFAEEFTDVLARHSAEAAVPAAALVLLTRLERQADAKIDWQRTHGEHGRPFPIGTPRTLTCRLAEDVALVLVVTTNADWVHGGAARSGHLTVRLVVHPRGGRPVEFLRETYRDQSAVTWPVVRAAMLAVDEAFRADDDYNCGRPGEPLEIPELGED